MQAQTLFGADRMALCRRLSTAFGGRLLIVRWLWLSVPVTNSWRLHSKSAHDIFIFQQTILTRMITETTGAVNMSVRHLKCY